MVLYEVALVVTEIEPTDIVSRVKAWMNPSLLRRRKSKQPELEEERDSRLVDCSKDKPLVVPLNTSIIEPFVFTVTLPSE